MKKIAKEVGGIAIALVALIGGALLIVGGKVVTEGSRGNVLDPVTIELMTQDALWNTILLIAGIAAFVAVCIVVGLIRAARSKKAGTNPAFVQRKIGF